jgi:redox-sensitive bicupin YhaK (pirin superfamily)
MATGTVLELKALGFPWHTWDPFLFCVHHDDAYPRSNGTLGPTGSLEGRDLGQDFEGKDGWRMYHGRTVPGFPQHPHRGFETVTLVRQGLVDHSDSLGATARFGQGDAQWLTAGQGIVHAEMFPLLDAARPNPLELFQIWLNLPARDKLVPPHFAMLWGPSMPRLRRLDDQGRAVDVTAVAGALEGQAPPAPPPHSWAARPEADVAVWTLRLDPHARFTLPRARAGTTRALYVFAGDAVRVDGEVVRRGQGARVRPEVDLSLENGAAEAEVLMLQGRPIGEPVVSYGPFVMNSQAEIQQAFLDYRRTEFGGWPWPDDGPTHGPGPERFARHADGRFEAGSTSASRG